jgi:AcrR family transcriptional regulator
MPKVTEAYLENRRQQILEAAIACFARNGFHQTTMEDIGQEAGLSPALAYRYFDSKDDIIVATVQQGADRAARFFDAVADGQDIPSLLQQMIHEHFQRFEQPGRDLYYKVRVQLWAEVIRNQEVAERLRVMREEAHAQITALIEKGQENGQINPNLDARAMTAAIEANLDGFVLHWLADPDVDVRQYRDALMAMVRGLFDHWE